MLATAWPRFGLRAAWGLGEGPMHYLPPQTDGAIDVMVRLAWRKNSPASFSVVFHLGGATAVMETGNLTG